MKKLMALVLAIVFMLSFNGCGDASNKGNETIQTSADTTSDEIQKTDESITDNTNYKEETTKNGEESSANRTSVFSTKNIKRITFYIDYGLSKGSDVSADDMEEIIKWLETFTIDKKVDGTCPPGTNTIYVEIEYLDGTIVKNGLDVIEVDGARYYIKRAMPPDCFQEILTK